MTDPAPSSLFPAIYAFLASNGLNKTKKKFKQEAKLDDNGLLKDQAPSSFSLMDLYRCYLKQNENKSHTPEKSGKSEEQSNTESQKKKKKDKKAKNGTHEKPVVAQEPESTKKGKKRKADEKDESEQTTEPKSEQKHKKQKIAEKSEDVSMATSSAEGKKDKKKKKKEKKEKKEEQKKEEASKSEKAKEEKKEEVKKETASTKSEGLKSEVEDGDDAGEDASETTASGKKKAKKDLTPSRFQRIKAEEISIGDGRLADNSYFAKGGESWGAKAQQDLGVVKGDRFRHEKTKKKRGSYRGGAISTEVFSVPFPDSDDE